MRDILAEDAAPFRKLIMSKATGIGVALLLMLGAGSVMLAAPGTAGASASGCSYFGNLGSIKGFPVYRGNYCASISSSGTNVYSVSGHFLSYGPIYNWSLTAEFFDAAGHWYRTYSTGTHYGGSAYSGDGIAIYARMRPGFMCSTLQQNGGRITSVCHNLY